MSEKSVRLLLQNYNFYMKRILVFIFKYFIYWLLFFTSFRILFLIIYRNILSTNHVQWKEVLEIPWHSTSLDLSLIGYFSSIIFVIMLVNLFINRPLFRKIIDSLTYLFITLFSTVSMGEIGIYDEWRTKLNFKALVYLKQPSEVFNSISLWQFLFLFILWLGIIAFWIFIYRKYFRYPQKIEINTGWKKTLFIGICPVFIFYFIRGGFQEIPIQQSDAWFSKKMILNDVSVNPSWSLAFNLMNMKNSTGENPFRTFDDNYAQQMVKEMHFIEKDTTISILTTHKPNIVIILLESWPATVIESISGDDYITPNFHELEKEGILFTNLYASGNRSQQGMAAIFAGFPSIPVTTLTDYPEKYSKVPSLPKILNQHGWHSSFLFGGQLRYGNIKSYVIANEFHEILEGEDFPNSVPKGRLGVHDEYLFQRSIEELKTEKEPFFSVLFTLSSHSPYDQPLQNAIRKDISELPFINSVHYTDKTLGNYIKWAKNQKWYNNTLFIIVADHSHVSHHNHPLQTFEYHQIPMLFMGHVIKPEFRGTKYDKVASQTDLPTTLLKQLNLNSDEFSWSKNLFNPYTPEFAYFELNEGVGWKSSEGIFVYNFTQDHYYQKELDSIHAEKNIIFGKSYIQEVYRQFMNF
ncbi:MAG: sulfatase-like hydrolase/transferase [Bacteroidales bacterium]|nr:sulfatase-like hydrolase/transferase [Bacteroidales bacterium]